MSDDKNPLADLRMDTKNMYREEVFTDLTVGTLRRLTPVRLDGSPDPDRQVMFTAETQLMSQPCCANVICCANDCCSSGLSSLLLPLFCLPFSCCCLAPFF